MNIEWDEAKNAANRKRHGVGFEEVRELFASDRDYLEIYDVAHSILEDRFIAIGMIARGVVAVVSTERDENTVRIISARWATTREQCLYRDYMEHRHD